ncbi:bifunctional DNA primase/polymerase [Nocardiopsis sediminis]|uniref:Bifunctional DNA primase/polymerase n=1 Tax=Nocardiopsis sediminis TaxID=1778267 RepID=A0ABV8FPZ4_9ACTN
MTTANVLPSVLAAAARGWHVFPLICGTKRPDRRFTDWEHHATTDSEAIRAFWGSGRFNYGIATGPSGLVVIDLDTPKPGESVPPEWAKPGITDGADVFADLAEQAGVLDQEGGYDATFNTFTVRTRRGGTHLYYTPPEGVRFRNTKGGTPRGLGWLIDTRAQGGYVVGPSSYVADEDGAGHYEVINPAAAAPLPTWLADRLTPKPDLRPVDAGKVRHLLIRGNAAGYGAAALRGEVERVLGSSPGSRNHALNTAAFALGQLVAGGVLPIGLVQDALLAAGCNVGLSERECAATISSGLRSGAREPRGGAA